MKSDHYSEVKILELNAMRVACHRTISIEPEIEGKAFLTQWYTQNVSPDASQARMFGFDVDVKEEQAKQGLRGYEFWITVPEGVQPSPDVTIKNFAGGLYAVMRIHEAFTDPYGLIPPGWQKLHHWVIDSDTYIPAEHQWLEEAVGLEGSDLDLYHPVGIAAR